MVAAAAVVLVVAGLGGCRDKDKEPSLGGDDGPSTVEQGQALKTLTEGKLQVCTDVPRPPFTFDEKGEVRGITVDVLRAMGGRLALAPEFKDVEAGALVSSLDSKQCDVAAPAFVVDVGVRSSHEVTSSYFEVRQALLVRKADEATYRDLASLKGRTVGVVRGARGGAVVSKLGEGVVVREFPSAGEALAALGSSSVDGVVHDQPVVAYSAKTSGATVVSVVFGDEPADEYGFVVPKGQSGLLEALNKSLREIRTDDSYRTILTAYLGAVTS